MIILIIRNFQTCRNVWDKNQYNTFIIYCSIPMITVTTKSHITVFSSGKLCKCGLDIFLDLHTNGVWEIFGQSDLWCAESFGSDFCGIKSSRSTVKRHKLTVNWNYSKKSNKNLPFFDGKTRTVHKNVNVYSCIWSWISNKIRRVHSSIKSIKIWRNGRKRRGIFTFKCQAVQ